MRQLERIAVIPARRRSRRCPNKNWKAFHQGKSLTQILVEKCEQSGLFDRIIISVDFDVTPEFRDSVCKFPTSYFRVRPWWHRRWMTSEMVLEDVLEFEDNEPAYFFMQPTSPLLSIERMKQAANMLVNANAVVSVNPALKPNGAIYAGYAKYFLQILMFWPRKTALLKMEWEESIDVDYECDFRVAQQLYRGE